MGKAHPDIYNILLQILDEGKSTESTGERVSFSRSLFILTTNIGSKTLRFSYSRRGIFKARRDLFCDTCFEKRYVSLQIARFFRPELMNRLDDVVLFSPL